MSVLEVRRMRPVELARVADLYVRSITNLLRDILTPEQIRGDDDYREHFTNRIANDHEVWLAVRVGRPAGVMAITEEWIEQLYVDPPQQRQGVGSALLARAKALSPNSLRLVTLQRNAGACRFYERHGFAAYDRGLRGCVQNNLEVAFPSVSATHRWGTDGTWTSAVRFQQEALPSSTVELRIRVPPA